MSMNKIQILENAQKEERCALCERKALLSNLTVSVELCVSEGGTRQLIVQ